MIIYKVTNLIDGKIYIGKTEKTLEQRKSRHLYQVNNKQYNSIFHSAIRKYGQENFIWEIIDNCLFIELEKFYIKKFNSKAPNGYNLTDGGEGMCGYSYGPLSDEHKKKISDNAKTNPNYGMRGKHMTKEQISKISISCKGIKFSDEHKLKIGIANKGKKHGGHGRHVPWSQARWDAEYKRKGLEVKL